jgi:lysophospholipase L1-like esterase
MPPPARRSSGLFTALFVGGCLLAAVAIMPRGRTPDAAAAPSSAPAPSACAAPAPPPPPASARPAARRVCTVAAIGDSLTDARSNGGGYLTLLAGRCPKSRFDNYGKGGDMTNQMRRRFQGEVVTGDKPRYTHVIVFGGVNDLYSDETAGRTVPKISADLGAMYDLAHQRGMRVVAITVAPWGGFKRYYNERRGRATLELNGWIATSAPTDAVVDAYALLSCGDPERLCPEVAKPYRDGIHFGPVGHEKLGEALYAAVFRDCL